MLDEAGLATAVAHRLVLQRALAALVADRAVERVVDEQQLHDALLRLVGDRLVACVLTTMPSATVSVHEACGLGMPRPLPASGTSTRHCRQAPTGRQQRVSQNRGICTPTCSAARITRVSLGTETSTPSMVTVTSSTFSTWPWWPSRGRSSRQCLLAGEGGAGLAVEGAAAVGEVGEVLLAEVLHRRGDRAGGAVAEGAEGAARMLSQTSSSMSRSDSEPLPCSRLASVWTSHQVPSRHGVHFRTTRACRTPSTAARRGPRRWSRRRPAARGCRASSPPRRRPRSRAARRGARRSAAACSSRRGPELQLVALAMPPARSMSWRSVMPSGASNWPGLVTWPERLKMP